MKYQEYTLSNIKNFELKDIFECGQCFRWKKEIDDSYTGVVKAGVLNVSKIKNDVLIKGYVDDNCKFEDFIIDYFDLNEDYSKIQRDISKNDSTMAEAVKFGNGIRILNQNSFEMLISYIISAANNIPRITKCINNISKEYGKKIIIPKDICSKMFSFEKDDEEFYLFPTCKELSKASLTTLRECNLGFRDKFVLDNAIKVAQSEIDLVQIEKCDYIDAKKQLTKLNGVGEKVADCILLFSMKKKEAFPVDTWIKKIMNETYIDSTSVKKIGEYARNKWGRNSGIAQQYLFYYKREN